MQASEVKGSGTSHRSWMALVIGLLLIVATTWITTTQYVGSDNGHTSVGANAGSTLTSGSVDRADWIAQHRAAAPYRLLSGSAAGDRAGINTELRGELHIAMMGATTDRADTIQHLRGQARQYTTRPMDRADMINALRLVSTP